MFAKYFGDGTFENRDPRTIIALPLALIALFFLRGLGDFTQTYCMGYVGRRIVKQLRSEVFDRVMQLPVGYYDRNSTGTLLSRLTFNTEQVGQASTDSVTVAVREALTLIGSVFLLFYLNTRLAFVALTMGPVIAWLVTIINRKFRRYSRRIQDSMADVTTVAKEALEAPRVIKVYNAENYKISQFEAVNEHNRRSNMRLILTRGLSNPVVQMVMSFGSAFVLSVAISDAINNRMSMGDLLAFLVALVQIAQPLRSLVGVAGPIQQGIAAGESIFTLIDQPVELRGGSLKPQRVQGDIEFDHIGFTYPAGKGEALRDVTFTVSRGEMIAIVGRSGSGKSTLVNLLPRFYDVNTGAVRVDGHDVREYDLTALREQIALVSQDVVLFNDTIFANLLLGRPEATRQEVEQAARDASAYDFIQELPQGFETMVGERGAQLSGGQRQRIALARAFLRQAAFLILVEATSALDSDSEAAVQQALRRLMAGRTVFIIAHRFSTIRDATMILVFEAGQIAAQGTHSELYAGSPLYRSLYDRQLTVGVTP